MCIRDSVYQGAGASVRRHWAPPELGSGPRTSFVDGAAELRALLEQATAERLAPAGGATSVWLSGGWDSTAVYASAARVLAGAGQGDRLRAVSVSYPPGDPGREDELIELAAGRWGGGVARRKVLFLARRTT